MDTLESMPAFDVMSRVRLAVALGIQQCGLGNLLGRHLADITQRIDATITGLGVGSKAGVFLYLVARYGPARGRIVEIGSGFGRSTCFLAAGSQRGNREHVWAVDPHTGGRLYLEKRRLKRIDSYPGFMANIRRLGLEDWIHPLVMTSEEASRSWKGDPIRLLFIDGWHTYDAVKLDIQCWMPFVVKGGIVIFDDYFNPDFPGVRKAIDEMLSTQNVKLPLRRFNQMVWTFKTCIAV